MNNLAIDKYIITYSNHFEFNGRILAFRKKILFDITNVPRLIKEANQGWWINRILLSKQKVKELIKHEPIDVDVSALQWFEQVNLEECFNL